MDSKLRSEIAKLVLMMTSNHDQEAIAAVRAIERKLMAANCTMHDLADLVRGGASQSAPSVRGSDAETIRFCFEKAAQLAQRERMFVEDIYYRLVAYPQMKLSEKQKRWLASIYAKLKLYGT
jgi:hypothetical protein